ncbi:DUF4032 domain-containing protein [Aeromicrobium sp. A1-2]|uniref:DUF4032 domain-containing protein n=1 Tax=Aeromicrobium sp. A1-2 TaxID=2107713 RepID=UPI000E4C082F|nr:DUF4032 domain-containing protein [Aeromicrobium sp. A1-2]AXT86943.1 DUF4032 domain-containing protein [Aeromicrobium sp. A1-2]
MPLRIVANRPDPAILNLPWSTPLEDWSDEYVVPLPRGLSRHVVRIVRLGRRTYAIKETTEEIAFREYRLLRELDRLRLPTVLAQGVVAGRTDSQQNPLPTALLTEHLRFSLPYRSLFSHGLTVENIPSLVDALVVLLVRLHLSNFYWGDVSLSNVLFRRDAGAFSAYLVDAETGELHPTLSERLREHDVTVGCENVFAELLDLEASNAVEGDVAVFAIVDRIRERYDALWSELTGAEQFGADEMWRIEQRIERLNDLGFDVDELDINTGVDGDQIQIRPRVVELGHHRRELQELTGMNVEDNQARRLLNDLASYTANCDLSREDRDVVANQWMSRYYEPIVALVPPELRGKLEAPEVYHEILHHRWTLSEQAGREVDIFEAARDYIQHVLSRRPDEVMAPPEMPPPALTT